MYNNIQTTLLPVEKPLLKDKIELIYRILKPGIEKLKWKDENINPFIKEAMSVITDINELVKKMKENVKSMNSKCANWWRPLYDRKNKLMSPDDFEQTHSASVDQRLQIIKEEGRDINKLLKDTMDHTKSNKKSVEWLAYHDYTNSVIIEGITSAIVSSLQHFSNQLLEEYNRHNDLMPMFDIKVDLIDNQVCFDPPISNSPKENSIKNIIFRIVDNFISIASLIPRLDQNPGDYLMEIKDQFQVLFGISQITKNMRHMEIESVNLTEKYNEFPFLWKEDIETSFQAFLDSGEIPVYKKPVEEVEEGESEDDETYIWIAEIILKGIIVRRPTLEKFDDKITYLTAVKTKIQDIVTPTTKGWLKINLQPLKNCSWRNHDSVDK